MKFADLLQLQKPLQSLENLHSTAMAYAALNPRLRTCLHKGNIALCD
jgi:hypothetical protein